MDTILRSNLKISKNLVASYVEFVEEDRQSTYFDILSTDISEENDSDIKITFEI